MAEAQTPLMIASHKIGVAIGELNGVRVSTWAPENRDLWQYTVKILESAREHIDYLADKEACTESD